MSVRNPPSDVAGASGCGAQTRRKAMLPAFVCWVPHKLDAVANALGGEIKEEASAAGRRRGTFAPKGIRNRRPRQRTQRASLEREKCKKKPAQGAGVEVLPGCITGKRIRAVRGCADAPLPREVLAPNHVAAQRARDPADSGRGADGLGAVEPVC